jgi:uncharacterized protein YdcH (DUF465 family)
MQIENHSLVKEFPEHKGVIHDLKLNDGHFARLFDEYHEVEKEVHRLESENTPVADEYIEGLKKKRLALKDELYALVQAAA